MGNMCASSTDCRSAPDNSAASDHRAATINAPTVVGAPTAILIVRITIAATISIGRAAYGHTPSNDRSAAISGTTSNCPTLELHRLEVECLCVASDLHYLTVMVPVPALARSFEKT